MNQNLTRLALGAAALAASMQAGAVVLDFEDLGTGAYFSTLTNAEYKGFRFGTTSAATWFWNDTIPAVAPYVPASGDTWLGMVGGYNPAPAITSTVDFVFDGARFAGFEFVYYKLYLNGTEVGPAVSPQCLLGPTPSFCASGYSGLVDAVVIYSNPIYGDVYFAMDDFTYNSQVPIPEPGTYALMASGLAALALALRRRWKPVSFPPGRSGSQGLPRFPQIGVGVAASPAFSGLLSARRSMALTASASGPRSL